MEPGAVVMSEPIVVPGVLAGERIDRAVALLTGWSRADVQVLLARAAIVIDGHAVSKSHKLVEGSVIEVLEEPAVGVIGLDCDVLPVSGRRRDLRAAG